ncbi:hypothetical protein MSG28_000107 [Choristoneura fumiferana]|uniref:Uncharacterized protein n=1 Tax=Choristoneura fumiferana TaxID=7141 RepID=A0ACC0JZ95_CHOFU|nr:hypothetical protein MSG28_000107 [Choristoneura fumiferana]
MISELEACCCTSREPCMTQTCLECLFGLSDNYCLPPPKCGCGCFKDIKKPLDLCQPKCQPPTVLYYPQVEYPITGYNTNPFYYNNCFGY